MIWICRRYFKTVLKIKGFMYSFNFSPKKAAKPSASDSSLPGGSWFPIGSFVREFNSPNIFFWLPWVSSTAVFKYRHLLFSAFGGRYFLHLDNPSCVPQSQI